MVYYDPKSAHLGLLLPPSYHLFQSVPGFQECQELLGFRSTA